MKNADSATVRRDNAARVCLTAHRMKPISSIRPFSMSAIMAVLLVLVAPRPLLLGQDAGGGQSVFSHPYLGIDLDLPEGWEAQAAATGFLLAHPDFSGAIAVMAHEHDSQTALQAAARRGLREMGQVALQLRGTLAPFQENGQQGTFEGIAEGKQVQAHAVFLLSPYGGGVTVLIPLPNGIAPGPYIDLATTIAKGIRFQPRIDSDPLDPWKERLLNCRLTHLPNPDAAPDGDAQHPAGQRVVLDLCDDGRFHLTLPDDPEIIERWTGARAFPSHDSAKPGMLVGDWFLVRREGRARLRLDFPGGTRREFLLSLPNGSTYLDELRVFRS